MTSDSQQTQTQTKPKTERLFPIVHMFAQARKSLRRPVVRFKTLDDAHELRLAFASPRSKNAGYIYVTSNDKDVGYYDRTYYGKISPDGKYIRGWVQQKMHPKLWHNLQETINATLIKFADDPREYAKITGQKFGYCCFCARELTAPDSVACGYGPICAEHYGLPHTGMAQNLERQRDYEDALADVDDFALDSRQAKDGGESPDDPRKLQSAYNHDVAVETIALYLDNVLASYIETRRWRPREMAEKIIEFLR